MFRCEICKQLSAPREKGVLVVIDKVKHFFPFRAGAHSFVRDGKIEVRDDPGGVGWQIRKEIRVHQRCAKVEEEQYGSL